MMPNKTTLLNLIILIIMFVLIRIIIHTLFIVDNIERFGSGLSTNKLEVFCNASVGNSTTLNEKCGQLMPNNCKATTCCVFTSDQQCLAGGYDGPTFNTENGKTKKLDYYYFNKSCYGDKCP
jgi:hypothetical protein